MRRLVRPLVAVLGLGEMGMIHATNLSKQRGIRLGLASGRADALSQASKALRADASFASYDDALNDPDVVAVVIATAPPSHPHLIRAAADAGKMIFSEKPLGYSVEEVALALAALRENKIQRFMAGFMRRWDPAYIRGRLAVDTGEIGAPVALKCTSGDAGYPEKYRRPGSAPEHTMLKDLAVHDVDLARWLLRSEVKRVYASSAAMSYPELADFGDADLVMAVLEMESGARVGIHWSRALDYGYNVTSELVCTKGTVQLGEVKQTSATVLKAGHAAVDIAPAFPERFVVAFEREMHAFAELVLANTDADAALMVENNSSYANAVDGIRVTEVAEALVRSVQSGSTVLVERRDYH
jgi:predicted dehydrogenase